MCARLLRRLAVLGSCIAVAVSGLVVGAAAPAAAHPGVPSSLYDPNVVSWGSWRNLTRDEFESRVAERRNAGQMLIDLDYDDPNGHIRFGAVFQRNLDGRDWIVEGGLGTDVLLQAIDLRRQLGMRLVDVEPIVVARRHVWAALWVENVEGYSWNVTLNALNLTQFANNERAAGRMLIDVDMYPATLNQCCLGAAISVANAESRVWTLSWNLTDSEFHAVFDALKGTHRALVADSGNTPTGQRFSAVWLANRAGRGKFIFRNMTINQWEAKWQELRDAGQRVINFERYETANGTRYLGVWRQNT